MRNGFDSGIVMLSNAKHLLANNALSTQTMVGFEEILHFVQNDNTVRHY